MGNSNSSTTITEEAKRAQRDEALTRQINAMQDDLVSGVSKPSREDVIKYYQLGVQLRPELAGHGTIPLQAWDKDEEEEKAEGRQDFPELEALLDRFQDASKHSEVGPADNDEIISCWIVSHDPEYLRILKDSLSHTSIDKLTRSSASWALGSLFQQYGHLAHFLSE